MYEFDDFSYLGVSNDPDDLAVLGELLDVAFDGLLAQIVAPFLGSLGESLLLALVPNQYTKLIRKRKKAPEKTTESGKGAPHSLAETSPSSHT